MKKLPAYTYNGRYYSLYFIYMRQDEDDDPLYYGIYVDADDETINFDQYEMGGVVKLESERVTYFGRIPPDIQKLLVKGIKGFIDITDNFLAGVMAKQELDRIKRKWPEAME